MQIIFEKTAGRGKARGRGQRAEGRGQGAKGRGQRAKGRGQRAESRGTGYWISRLLTFDHRFCTFHK
jgi:hypothetical protein